MTVDTMTNVMREYLATRGLKLMSSLDGDALDEPAALRGLAEAACKDREILVVNLFEMDDGGESSFSIAEWNPDARTRTVPPDELAKLRAQMFASL